MYGLETRRLAITMCRSGMPHQEIARLLTVPLETIRRWKFEDRATNPGAYPCARQWREVLCPLCHGADLDLVAYSYLLGLYLGDGHINPKYKRHNISIYCDDKYPGLQAAAERTLQETLPQAATHRIQRPGCLQITSYSKHWACLFPQHGPGRKHTRRIELAAWQTAIVEEQPWEFIRGLIHSDGCRYTHGTTHKLVTGELKRYEYPRYTFTNTSADIRNIFTWALDMQCVEWNATCALNITIAKCASVALLDSFVGPKY